MNHTPIYPGEHIIEPARIMLDAGQSFYGYTLPAPVFASTIQLGNALRRFETDLDGHTLTVELDTSDQTIAILDGPNAGNFDLDAMTPPQARTIGLLLFLLSQETSLACPKKSTNTTP